MHCESQDFLAKGLLAKPPEFPHWRPLLYRLQFRRRPYCRAV